MILIFRHVDCEGPGYLAEFLDAHHYPYRLLAIDADEPVPDSLDGVSGLVFMGGSMSVNDDLPWINKELELIRRADAASIPILGHCLGAQLLAKALGSEVVANPVTEIGWFPVHKSFDSFAYAGLEVLPDEFMVYHWHGETFNLPKGSTRIWQNEHCENQGFVLRDHIGLQCHIEMTEPMVHEWLARFGDELEFSDSVQKPQEMTMDLAQRVSKLKTIADVVYSAWLTRVQHRE